MTRARATSVGGRFAAAASQLPLREMAPLPHFMARFPVSWVLDAHFPRRWRRSGACAAARYLRDTFGGVVSLPACFVGACVVYITAEADGICIKWRPVSGHAGRPSASRCREIGADGSAAPLQLGPRPMAPDNRERERGSPLPNGIKTACRRCTSGAAAAVPGRVLFLDGCNRGYRGMAVQSSLARRGHVPSVAVIA